MIGKTISHYKILEKLGSGGMGVVYKAEDIKLKRIVALKFLPHHLSISSEDNTRLLNEAQITAKLNHPHICTIYDIEEAGEEKFIVMEFVDGVTLRTKIKESTLNIDESVSYAIQIGEALEEAHGHGVIHRDIKPDNIMINSKNQIKVMDFGIAKLKENLGITKTMSTSGTVSYMAPEQLSNSTIDARVDIFSLGILFYEMLSSRLPFRGDHQAAMMYSIMNEEPEPINKYLSEVPSEMLHVLNRALEKNPEDRYQNVHDMVIDLRRLKKQTGGISHHAATHEHLENISEPTPKSFGWLRNKSQKRLAIISLVILFGICAGIFLLFIPSGPQLNPEMKTRTIQLPFKNVYRGSMSKDGNWVVFSAEDENGKYDVYMMNLADEKPRKVTSNSRGRITFSMISPDANTILFTRYNNEKNHSETVSISSSGGSERVIIEKGGLSDWRSDGQRFLYGVITALPNNKRENACWSARPDGSDRHFEFADTFKYYLGYRQCFSYSPDGNSIAFTKNYSAGYNEIMIYNLKSKTYKQLTFDKKFADDPRWSPYGKIIYSSNRSGNANLWVIPSSGGEPIQFTRGSGYDVVSGFSSDGKRFLYAETREGLGQIFIGNLKSGEFKQLTYDDRIRLFPIISHDGKQIAFIAQELNDVSFIRNVYIMDIDGSNVHRITDDNTYKTFPSWSFDDKWIVYSAGPPGQPADSMRIYFVPTDNSAPPRTIGYGQAAQFFNEREFTFRKFLTTYKSSIDSKNVEKISEDSLSITPVLNGKYLWIYNYHRSDRTLYIVPTANFNLSGLKNAKQIYKGIVYLVWVSVHEIYYLRSEHGYELRKITFPEGKDVKWNAKFPGIEPSYDFSISKDGKTIVYANYYNTAKYVVIDNLFK